MKYLLIYDTGDMIVDTQKDAMKWVKYLRKKGHKIDRLQTNVNVHEGKRPKIIKTWKR